MLYHFLNSFCTFELNFMFVLSCSPPFNASTPFQEMLKDVSDCITSHKLSTKSEKRPDTILRLGKTIWLLIQII